MRRSLWLFPLILGTACAHKEAKKEPIAAAPVTQPEEKKSDPTPASATRSCTADKDCAANEICEQSQCVVPTAAQCGEVRVHFGFNDSEIEGVDRPLLERSARCLSGHQHLKVTIEGNADERGTEEYNLALGDRRAIAVAKYLEKLGVPDAQLHTVSYGKVKPLCNSHDEACWAQNRRAQVEQGANAAK